MRYAHKISKPDMDEICFGRNKGEFSDEADIAFNLHLDRLKKYAYEYRNENGKRIDLILLQEPLWFALNIRKENK
jgi:hypothetical protein